MLGRDSLRSFHRLSLSINLYPVKTLRLYVSWTILYKTEPKDNIKNSINLNYLSGSFEFHIRLIQSCFFVSHSDLFFLLAFGGHHELMIPYRTSLHSKQFWDQRLRLFAETVLYSSSKTCHHRFEPILILSNFAFEGTSWYRGRESLSKRLFGTEYPLFVKIPLCHSIL